MPDELRNNATTRNFLILRSIIGTTCFILWVYSVDLLRLGPMMCINNTSPFWAILIGYCFLNERITCFEVICMLFSFSGILLIATAKNEDEEIVRTQ